MNFVEKEGFRLNQKFSYSWLTNKIGNVWDIMKHPCQEAHIKQLGMDLYSQDALSTYVGSSPVSNMFHTSNCALPYPDAIPSYPCADSYPGFSEEVDLDLG